MPRSRVTSSKVVKPARPRMSSYTSGSAILRNSPQVFAPSTVQYRRSLSTTSRGRTIRSPSQFECPYTNSATPFTLRDRWGQTHRALGAGVVERSSLVASFHRPPEASYRPSLAVKPPDAPDNPIELKVVPLAPVGQLSP
jgi:hypothetical protein